MNRFLFIIIFGLLPLSRTIGATTEGLSIRGKVTDMGGKPLSGASIAITGTYIGVYTDAEGTYVLSGLKGGSYVLQVSFIGYDMQTEEVKLQTDTVLNFTLAERAVRTEALHQ